MDTQQLFIDIVKSLFAAVGGFISAYIIFRFNIKRRVLEYNSTSMPLLRFSPDVQQKLTVTVDKAALTGRPDDQGTPTSIGSAHGFTIWLRNAGNELIEDAFVDVALDETARIIEYYIEPPPTSDYELRATIDPNKLNRLNVQIPYLNPGRVLHISLVSAENKNASTCTIDARGKGLQVRRYGIFRSNTFQISISVIIVALLLFFENALKYEWIPNTVWSALGATIVTTTVSTITWPLLHKIVALVLFGVLFIWVIASFIRTAPPDIDKPWGEE